MKSKKKEEFTWENQDSSNPESEGEEEGTVEAIGDAGESAGEEVFFFYAPSLSAVVFRSTNHKHLSRKRDGKQRILMEIGRSTDFSLCLFLIPEQNDEKEDESKQKLALRCGRGKSPARSRRKC